MVQRLVQVALLLLSCLQCAYSQHSSATSAGVYDGQVFDAAHTPHIGCKVLLLYFESTRPDADLITLYTQQAESALYCLHLCAVQPDSCGYGEIPPSVFPYGHLATFSSSSPPLTGLPQGGCGACLQVTCTDPTEVG